MIRSLLLSAVLASSAAYAQSEEPEVRVEGTKLLAKFGIRLETETEWQRELPLAYEKAYRVKKESGAEYRLWLHASGAQEKPASRGGVFKGPGKYALTDISGRTQLAHKVAVPDLLSAAGIEPSVPELLLRDDGSYQMGSTQGHWKRVGGQLVLDGAFESWGRGEVSEDGNGLSFVAGGLLQTRLQLTRVEAIASL